MTPVEIPTVTTVEEIEAAISTGKPLLMLMHADQSPRRDAELALRDMQEKHGNKLKAFVVDARKTPEIAERFSLGKNPVLIGWVQGEARIRRNKPWNTDVIGIADDLLALAPVIEGAPEDEPDQPAAANGKPVVVTDATFVELVMESPIPVLVDFWAEWCQPCKMVAPILVKLAAEYAGRVRIAKVDVDNNQVLAQQFGIQSIPTLMFVKGGKVVGQSAGAAPEPALRGALDQLISMQV
jgi:thioredoxin 1